jgi:hypothetical protein
MIKSRKRWVERVVSMRAKRNIYNVIINKSEGKIAQNTLALMGRQFENTS